jgi:lipopolysaccharide transport system permease protein
VTRDSSNFYIATSIAKKNFTKMVRENLLGLLWLFLTPLLYSVFFLLVKSSISGENVSSNELRMSAFNAFIGLLLLQLWFQVIQETANIIRKNKNSLRSLNVSVTPFLLAVLIEAIVYLLIRIVIILLAFLIFDIDRSLSGMNVAILTLVGFSYILTCLFIGLLLAPWATLFSDIRSFLSSALMPVALLSPIFYFPVNESGSFLFWVNHLVPFASIQAVISDLLFRGETMYLLPLVIWSSVSFVGIFIFAALLKQQTPILLERLGN